MEAGNTPSGSDNILQQNTPIGQIVACPRIRLQPDDKSSRNRTGSSDTLQWKPEAMAGDWHSEVPRLLV